jgi:hypothetical protein
VGALAERKIEISWVTRPEGKQARNDEIRARRRRGELLRELAQDNEISIQRVEQIIKKPT